jgi:hypothetical protein
MNTNRLNSFTDGVVAVIIGSAQLANLFFGSVSVSISAVGASVWQICQPMVAQTGGTNSVLGRVHICDSWSVPLDNMILCPTNSVSKNIRNSGGQDYMALKEVIGVAI